MRQIRSYLTVLINYDYLNNLEAFYVTTLKLFNIYTRRAFYTFHLKFQEALLEYTKTWETFSKESSTSSMGQNPVSFSAAALE